MGIVYPIKDKKSLDTIRKILNKEINKNKKRDKQQSYIYKRIWIMFNIGIYTGLRISDILQLKVKDVRNKEKIILKAKKTKKRTERIIHPKLKEELKEYIKGKPGDEYLIKTTKKEEGQDINKAISTTQAYRDIKIIEDKAKIKVNLGTHSLRKTYGYFLYKNEDLSIVQTALNHESQRDTLRYIGVEEEEIIKATQKLNYF